MSEPDLGVVSELSAAGAPPRWQLLPLLLTQGLWLKHRTPRLPPAPGRHSGVCGHGRPLQLLGLGDSIIAGVGVADMGQALTAQVAATLATRTGRQVHWRALGESGIRSPQLLGLLEQAAPAPASPDLLLVNCGVNDVTSPQAPATVMQQRRALLEQLEQRFPHALRVQCALPPMARFPALPVPLRQVLGRRAAALDRDLAGWLQGRVNTLFLPFDELPEPHQFAVDGYHPGPAAVAQWGARVGLRILERKRLLP